MLCNTCLKRSKCHKTCLSLNNYLRRQGIYSSDYIRPQVSRLNAKKYNKGKWREVPNSALSFAPEDTNPLLNNYDHLTSDTNI